MSKRIFSLALLLFCITSCGPFYSTNYKFTPPKSASGKGCIENCEYYEDQCKDQMRYNKDNCEDDNTRRVDDCNDRIQREKNRAPKWTECGRQITCDFPESKCEQEYRNCYQRCGGIVKEERVCVANCEKANSQ